MFIASECSDRNYTAAECGYFTIPHNPEENIVHNNLACVK